NPKEDLKGITTRSGNAYQGPTIPTTFSSLPKVVDRETALKDDPTSSEVDHSYYDTEGDIILLEAFLNDDLSLPLPLKESVQHQRKVNPKIHDVIKKEVEKLLDARLIYPISDSPWVSPVHCVPKKGGFTVVENDENKLIPTRLVMG
nr:reverse transcriptase domain-containing protein [Tanacetum cinerariifolium]